MAEILPSYIDAEFCMMMTHLVNMPNTHTHAMAITDTILGAQHFWKGGGGG